MSTVRAFQPRKIDPPHFVAECYDDLDDMVGDFVGAEQCDGCGNHSYEIRRRLTYPETSERGRYTYVAVCALDPDEPEEFRHPEPCGTSYPIGVYDEDLVVF